MTFMAPTPPPPASPIARAMAYLGYALLLAAPPTLGTAAILAAVLAYALNDGAAPLIRSHHRFQIRIFWSSLALYAAAGALALSALMDGVRAPGPGPRFEASPEAHTIAWRPNSPPTLEPAQWDGFHYSLRLGRWRWSRRARLEGFGASVLLGAALIWSIGAPIWGAARLASGRPIGHRRG